MKRVVVIGGGIMGLCTAWGLLRRGVSVTLLDRGPIPNPDSASFDRHRLIRYPYGALVGYRELVEAAYPAWTRLFGDLGEDLLVPTGTLVIGPPTAAWIESSSEDLAACNRPLEPLSEARCRTIAPGLRLRPGESARYQAFGGVLLADRIVTALARWCRDRGARMLARTSAISVDDASATMMLASGESVHADAVIIATGAWDAPAGSPGSGSRAFTPSRQVVRLIDVPRPAPDLPMILGLDDSDGFYLVPPVAGTPLKLGTHRFTRSGHPDDDRNPRAGEAHALDRIVEERFPSLRDLPFHDRVCYYAVTDDERFRLDRSHAVWRISGFSGHGFKFGAWVGDALADVLTGGLDAGSFERAFTGHGL